MNDRPLDPYKEQKNQGIREFQLYLHHEGLLVGLSNVNRWWGPGIHSSLTMSNNTAGFPHFFLGVSDKKLFSKNIKLNFNYMVGEVGEFVTPFYFTGFAGSLTHISKESDVTVGVTRTYVSGGIKLPGSRQWSIRGCSQITA